MSRKIIFQLAIYIPLACLLFYMAFRPTGVEQPFHSPDGSARASAVGGLSTLEIQYREVFKETELFSPLPKPRHGDWLNGPGKQDRKGQTFDQFIGGKRNPVTPRRRTIYIQPMGIFNDEEAEFIKSLQVFTAAFYQLPAKVLDVVDPRELNITRRINPQTDKPQLLSTDILDRLKNSVPADAYCVIALTLTDLYPQDSWNFVFGQASLAKRVGVFSLARYSPSFHRESNLQPEQEKYLVRLRACKVLSHELGHMFGMQHCIYYHCDMNGANNLQQTDSAPVHLCPVCLRKTFAAINYDPIARYQQLETYYLKFEMKLEADWVQKRIAQLTK